MILLLLLFTVSASADWSEPWTFEYEEEVIDAEPIINETTEPIVEEPIPEPIEEPEIIPEINETIPEPEPIIEEEPVYENEYDPQGFELYDTLSFGGKADVTQAPTFTVYSTLTFGGKANITGQSNSPPTMKGPNPEDTATDINITINLWNITIEDPEGDTFNWTIVTSPNVGSSSANGASNGSKSTALAGLSLSTTYTVYVNATDLGSKTWTNNTYTFTTRDAYTPDAPAVFTATASTKSKIDITWTDAEEADSTRVEWHTSADGTWDPGDHTLLYNGSAQTKSHTGLSPSTDYYYKAWSWNDTDGVWSTGSTDNAKTLNNNPPANSNPSPTNTSLGNALNPSLNITINDLDADTMNQSFWTNASGSWTAIAYNNGTKNASVENTTTSFPAYNTKYWWSSNLSDGYNWTNTTYNFRTKVNPINLTINGTSGAEETNVTLYGYMNTNDSIDTTVYFEMDLGDQSFSSPEVNQSVGEVSSGEFEKDMTGLSSGKLYYCRVKAGNSGGWNISWNTTYCFTKPQAPSGISIAQIGGGLNISWTHGSGYNVSKLYVNTTGYPVDRDSPGTIQVYSGSHDYYRHTGLSEGQVYYYRVWEYSSWSSPAVDAYSDGNVSASDTYYASSPVMSNPNPSNGQTAVLITTNTFNVTIKNYVGNFNWSIETSPNIGSASANNEGNGSKQCALSGLQYNTVYTVYANATTVGTSNHTNNTYTFTTQTNESPVLSNPLPANTATNVDKDLTLINITINDNDGDLFNWSIETKPDIGTNSSDGASNGTFSCTVSDLTYFTEYTWYVNVTDGINTVNQTYTFTTEEKAFNLISTLSFGGKAEVQDAAPVINSVSPANNSVDNDMYPLIEINITDSQDDKFNITWLSNVSGSWVVVQRNVSCTNGNFTHRATFANESNKTYWWKLSVNDTNNNWKNQTFNFKTALYTWGNWSDWWTFNYTVSGPSNLATSTWNSTAINLTWTNADSNADKTVLVRNESGWAGYPTSPSNGTEIYNGTKTTYNDTGLKPATVYYYSIWSWNETDDEYSEEYDSELGSTQGALSVSNPYPVNQSTEVSRPPTNISIDVSGTNIDATIYFYNMTPTNTGFIKLAEWSGESSGRLEVKNLNVINTTLKEFIWGNTTYNWTVNVTDGSTWINYSYWYTTKEFASGANARYDMVADDDVDVQDALLTWNNREGIAGYVYNGIYNVAGNDRDVDVQDALTVWNNRN